MKRFVLLCLALMLISGIVFANGTAETKTTANATETTFWVDSQQLEAGLVSATQGFMAEYPEYTIKVESFPGSERPEKLSLAKESGTLPSIFLTAFFTSADEVHQGTIIPVTDIINSSYKGLIGEKTLSTVEVNGEYYEVPVYTSPQGMLYNADIFKAAGLEKYISSSPNEIISWSLDDMDKVILPTLKEFFEGTNKYPLVLYAANEQNDSYLQNLLMLYDGNIFTNGLSTAGDDVNVVKALTKLKEWYDAGYTNSDVNTRLWTECNADFRNQLCAISAGQFATYLGHIGAFENGTAEKFDIRVATVPSEKGGNMHTYTYGFALMNVDEGQLEIARKFLDWYSKNADSHIINSGVPAISTVREKLQAEQPLYKAYQEAEKYLFDFTGAAPGYVSTRSVFYPEIQNAIAGNKTPQKALQDYQKNANEIISEFIENSVVLN